MVRTLILGIETVAGQAIAEQFSLAGHVTGLWFRKPQQVPGCRAVRLQSANLSDEVQDADVVIFCGNASASSWDDDFGKFDAEDKWLKPCVAAVVKHDRKFVFVSSDAVFQGPWVFHDDDSESLASGRTAKLLRKYESRILKRVDDALIVRANVLGSIGKNTLSHGLRALQYGRSVSADSATFSTPIAASSFAEILSRCVVENTSGTINIAGAERTTPFQLLQALARELNLSTDKIRPAHANAQSTERSLRCQRLHHELHIQPPLLTETLECLSDQATQRHAVAA